MISFRLKGTKRRGVGSDTGFTKKSFRVSTLFKISKEREEVLQDVFSLFSVRSPISG